MQSHTCAISSSSSASSPTMGSHPGQVFISPVWTHPTLAAWCMPASTSLVQQKTEGEAAFLSPGVAKLWLLWTSSGLLLGPLLGWFQKGQGHGAWLRYGTANRLARPGWMRPKKDAGIVQKAMPFLISHCPLTLLVPFSGDGLQFLQLLRGQMNSFSFESSRCDLRHFLLGRDA